MSRFLCYVLCFNSRLSFPLCSRLLCNFVCQIDDLWNTASITVMVVDGWIFQQRQETLLSTIWWAFYQFSWSCKVVSPNFSFWLLKGQSPRACRWNKPVEFDSEKSSSMTPPQFKIAQCMTALLKAKYFQSRKLGLYCSKIGLIGEPFVSVLTLFGYFKPTLVANTSVAASLRPISRTFQFRGLANLISEPCDQKGRADEEWKTIKSSLQSHGRVNNFLCGATRVF